MSERCASIWLRWTVYDPDAGQLYRALAKRNIPLGLARGSLSAAAAERIRETLAIDVKADA